MKPARTSLAQVKFADGFFFLFPIHIDQLLSLTGLLVEEAALRQHYFRGGILRFGSSLLLERSWRRTDVPSMEQFSTDVPVTSPLALLASSPYCSGGVLKSCSVPGQSWDLVRRHCNLISFISDLIIIAEQLLFSN